MPSEVRTYSNSNTALCFAIVGSEEETSDGTRTQTEKELPCAGSFTQPEGIRLEVRVHKTQKLVAVPVEWVSTFT